MLVTISEGQVDLKVDFEATIDIVIEPGVWQVTHRGQDYAITSLRGRLIDGHLYLAYPKGVARKGNGHWSVQERVLVGILPGQPAKDWLALPEELRSALEDAYLLARDELPEQVAR